MMPDRAINRDNEGKSELFKFEFAAKQVAAVVERQIRKSLTQPCLRPLSVYERSTWPHVLSIARTGKNLKFRGKYLK